MFQLWTVSFWINVNMILLRLLSLDEMRWDGRICVCVYIYNAFVYIYNLVLLLFRTQAIYPGTKRGRKVEIEDNIGDKYIMEAMGWVFRFITAFTWFFPSWPMYIKTYHWQTILCLPQAMEHFPPVMKLRSHLLAQECPMEPEGSPWDVVDLPCLPKISNWIDFYIFCKMPVPPISI